jgi:hypothetical protein
MVAGLAFLSKKGFNPRNGYNRKKVWEREQAVVNEEKRRKQREEELRRERDEEDISKARGEIPKLNFLYKPPPGLEGSSESNKHVKKEANSTDQELEKDDDDGGGGGDSKHNQHMNINNLTMRQPGDDDAAAAFRAILAGVATDDEDGGTGTGTLHEKPGAVIRGTMPGAFGTVLQGSSLDKMAAATSSKNSDGKKPAMMEDSMSSLEKAVGRRAMGGALTLEEQIERFPALANAPRQRGAQVGMSFKPLGTQIRNVRCMKCGIWGHSKGDRECELSGWNPFAAPSLRPKAPPPSVAEARDKEKEIHKRARHHHDTSPDDDRSTGSSDESSHHRRKKRKKKHHHRKRSYESSASDNDNSQSDDDSYYRRKKHRSKKKKKKHKRSSDREDRRRRQRSLSRSPECR